MNIESFSSYQFMPVGHRLLDSPIGKLRVTAFADGIGWVLLEKHDMPRPWTVLLTDIDVSTMIRISGHLARAKEELEAYFRGELSQFRVKLNLQGTDFQRQVWAALQGVSYGECCSYQDIANCIDRPAAVRAVGAANRANPAVIIVPCHRVIGKNGKLTGYAYGLEIKQYLLELESRTPGPAALKGQLDPMALT